MGVGYVSDFPYNGCERHMEVFALPVPTATEFDFRKEVEVLCNETVDEKELESRIRLLLSEEEVVFTLLRVTVENHTSLDVVTVTVSSSSHGYLSADVRIRR